MNFSDLDTFFCVWVDYYLICNVLVIKIFQFRF